MSANDPHPDTGESRPATCCGVCPPIAGGGYDCTCLGNARCEQPGMPGHGTVKA